MSGNLASRTSSRTRPAVALVIATAGYALNFWAWTLIGLLRPAAEHWFAVSDGELMLLTATAVVIGSLGRIPVGILTDRLGARVLFPAISLVAAVPVLALTAVDSGPALVAVACVLGVAGTAFAAGTALVARAYPRAGRGFAMSLFGGGMGVAAAAAIALRHVFDVDKTGRPPAAVGRPSELCGARRRVRPGPPGPPGPPRADMAVRPPGSAATRDAAPVGLLRGGLRRTGGHRPVPARLPAPVLPPALDQATLYTAVCIAVAAAGRPVGGWLCRRHNPVAVLRACYSATAAGGLLLAFELQVPAVAAPALVAVAACLGTASGVVQALIGATAPPHQAGTIAGVVGAAGGLAGLAPPLLLIAVHGINGSYSVGLTLLAGAALAAAAYLHVNGRWIGAALAFPSTTAPQHTATTVVALPPMPGGPHTPQIIAALTTLATRQELVIVCGSRDHSSSRSDGRELVAGLRFHLARHTIIAINVDTDPHPDETAMIAELLNDGALPVAITTGTNPEPVALLLAAALGADHVLRVSPDQVEGIVLQAPWTSVPPAVASGG